MTVTIRDVAVEAGVSVSTVSRVINNSAPVARKKTVAVNLAVHTLGYHPNPHAQALVSKRSGTLVIASPRGQVPVTLMAAAEQVAANCGKRLCFTMLPREPDATDIACNDSDALVIQDMESPGIRLAALLQRYPAAVLYGRLLSAFVRRCVFCDGFRAGHEAARYVRALGHRRVLIAGAGSHTEYLPQYGFRRAFAGIPGGTVADVVLAGRGDMPAYRDVPAQKVVSGFSGQYAGVTAIFCTRVQIASRVLEALHIAGIQVPAAVSVIAFDDGLSATMVPPVLTRTGIVSQTQTPARHAAALALRLAGAVTGGASPEERNCFRPQLVIRDTVMPPPDRVAWLACRRTLATLHD